MDGKIRVAIVPVDLKKGFLKAAAHANRMEKKRKVFHGGIDTQGLLPFGKPEEVKREVRRFMDLLGKDGGYILMASQGFEGDVPIENIEAVYSVDRSCFN